MLENRSEERLENEGPNHFMVKENKCAQRNSHSLWDLAGEQGLVQTARADKPNSRNRQWVSRSSDATDKLRKSNTSRGQELKPSKPPAHRKAEYFGVFSVCALERSPAPQPSALAGHQAALQANETGEPQSSEEKVSETARAGACKQCQLIREHRCSSPLHNVT